jgi:hypothetical protein
VTGTVAPAAFYCVSDARYFLGAVGLVNSLRLVGHSEPIYLLDCGLTDAQRELVAGEVTVVRDESETPPWLLKTIVPLRHPAEAMVLIDADMIVTRRLDEPIERARAGRVVAVENDRDRFVPEWGELLGLGRLRRQPYVSSGLVCVGRELGTRILSLMDRLQERVDFDRTFWRRNEPEYPFLYGDQDVLNAIVSSPEVEPDRLVALAHRLAPTPPFRRLRVVDEERMACRYADGGGEEPYLLHNFYRKPWLVPMRTNPYSRLLARALSGDGTPLRPPTSSMPIWLRPGPVGAAARLGLDAALSLPSYAYRKLHPEPGGHRGWADARWHAGGRRT